MINKVRKYFADSDKSIIFVIQKTSGSIYAGGLQRRWALKSCLSEFRHASGTALSFSVLFQTDYSLLIIHY